MPGGGTLVDPVQQLRFDDQELAADSSEGTLQPAQRASLEPGEPRLRGAVFGAYPD